MSHLLRCLRYAPIVLAVVFHTASAIAQDADESSSLVAEELLLDEVLDGELSPEEEAMEMAEEAPADEPDDDAEEAPEEADLLLELGIEEPADDTPSESVEDIAADALGEDSAAAMDEMPTVEEPVDEDLVLEEPVLEEAVVEDPAEDDLLTEPGLDEGTAEEKGAGPEPMEDVAEEAAPAEESVEEIAAEALGPEETAEPAEEDLLTELGLEEAEAEPEAPAEEEVMAEAPAEEAAPQPAAEDDLLMDLGLEEPAETTPAPEEEEEEEEAMAEAPAEEAAPEPAAEDDLLMDLGLEEPAEEEMAEPAPAAEPEQDRMMDLGLATPEEEPAEPEPDEAAAPAEPTEEEAPVDVAAPAEPEPAEPPVEEPAPTPTPPTAAQTEAAPAPDPVVMAQDEEEDAVPPSVTLMMETEELKRKALRNHTIANIEQGEDALDERRYPRARTYFENALETLDRLGRRDEDRRLRRKARERLAETFYEWAIVFRDQGDLEAASKMARNASSYGHSKAPRLVGEIEQAKVDPPPPPPPPDVPRWKEEEFQDTETDIAARLKEGRQYFMTAEYSKAKRQFRSILHLDPYNTEAIRMLEKTNRKMRQTATMEMEATRLDMLRELRQAWNPRDYGIEEQQRVEVVGPDTPQPGDQAQSQRVRILKKMESIVVPEIEFRQANIHDVVNFLQNASQEYDESEGPDAKQGVNIILNLRAAGGGGETGAAPAMDDPFATPAAEAAPQAGGVPLITFSARQISLLEALRIVTKVANLKYRIEGTVVMILPWDAPSGEIIVRTYDVLPSVEERISTVGAQLDTGGGGFGAPRTMGGGFGGGGDAGGGGAGEPVNWKSAFKEMGVAWPAGSSIKYVRAMGKLVVANTTDNLTTFEQILAELNVTPTQIEIEARFVEVNQTDLDSLGFEWLLTDDWEVAQQTGQQNVPLSERQRIIARANAAQGGFTRGNRFLQDGVGIGGTAVADGLMTIASVLTNPELSVVLHALQQRGGTDLLSAPKVLTQSGVEATIKVVTEYVYPTDYDIQTSSASETTEGGSGGGVRAFVEPSGFEVREVGVILTVTPEVSPEGQMIDLTMRPEVVSEPIWKDYGMDYTDERGNVQHIPLEQPFFFTRSISSTISIYDDATVVMGGMITENRVTVDDRIPFLGDIPLIGRLFRSSYEQSEKRNLLIFVTARLVDPAGRPIKSGQATAERL